MKPLTDALADLLPHVTRPATPTVTAYVPSESEVEKASDRYHLNVAAAVDRATAAGADAALCERLDAALRDAGHIGGGTTVAVVTAEQVATWHAAEQVPQPQVHVGPVPRLGQLVAWRQTWLPHIVVLSDRVGADIVVVGSDEQQELEVSGTADRHIHKGQPGGWSQRRYQERAEQHWDDNAQLVADRLVREAERSDPEVILVSGDTRALGFLTEHLPQRFRDRVVDLHAGGRGRDSSRDITDAAIAQAVREAAGSQRLQALQRVTDAVGNGRGAEGADEVLAALFAGTTAEVVVQLEAAEARTAWIGSQPQQVAAEAATLKALDLPADEVSVADAVIRGAAATGTDLVAVVDALADLADGVAAALLTGPKPSDR